MNRLLDPVLTTPHSERLHYATGELLGADDFQDEQTYHRRQLARALRTLHGSGTIAGLRVVVNHQSGDGFDDIEVELEVEPGLAVDRAGRLIEVPREACLRLRRWFDYGAGPRAAADTRLNPDVLRRAWRADAGIGAGGAVVADVFLAFHPCDRGYTPAFASGPFDALDASQPSRVRDGYELTLVPRPEADADLPNLVASDPWSAITGGTPAERLASAQALSFDMWERLAETPAEIPPGVDPTAILIARLRLPAAAAPSPAGMPDPDWSAAAWPDPLANVNNNVRNVLLPPAALRRVFGT